MSEECGLRTIREIATKEKSDRETEEANSISRGVWAETHFMTLVIKKKIYIF